MSRRCPNCHAEMVGYVCCGINWKDSMYDMKLWVCPDCGTEYTTTGGSPMRFCPACRDKKKLAEQEYWDKKRAGMRSIASEIVSHILAKGD